MLNINFTTLNPATLDALNTFLGAQVRITEQEAVFAPRMQEATEEVENAQAALNLLTIDHASKVWCDARDRLTLAVNKQDALKKALRDAVKEDRKTARNAANAIVPDHFYISYADAIAKGTTADFMGIVSNWLTSLGLQKRSKDKNGKHWAGAVGDILLACGIKNRKLEVKARGKSKIKEDVVTMLLFRGIVTCGAFDITEDGTIALHDFSKGAVTIDIDIEQYMR